MGKFTRLVNGLLRSFDESSSSPIYDQTVTINSTITSGTPVTLPSAGSFTVVSGVSSLNLYLNGQKLILGSDFNTSGSSPYTAVTFSFDLVNGDVVEFKMERA